MNITILPFDTIESTNLEAINQARRGADEGLCVTARQQTAGRGRHGRTWISPKDSGLYLSILLRPTIETRFLPLITFVGAVAVFETLRELYDLKPDIKWANDVHVNERKISGILAETAETEIGLAVILGIGINLNSSNFPDELADIATSIENETSKRPQKGELLRTLISKSINFYEILSRNDGAQKICKEWIARSTYAFGKQVSAKLERETITGITQGIEENGALRIETDDGKITIILAGDVEKVRAVSIESNAH